MVTSAPRRGLQRGFADRKPRSITDAGAPARRARGRGSPARRPDQSAGRSRTALPFISEYRSPGIAIAGNSPPPRGRLCVPRDLPRGGESGISNRFAGKLARGHDAIPVGSSATFTRFSRMNGAEDGHLAAVLKVTSPRSRLPRLNSFQAVVDRMLCAMLSSFTSVRVSPFLSKQCFPNIGLLHDRALAASAAAHQRRSVNATNGHRLFECPFIFEESGVKPPRRGIFGTVVGSMSLVSIFMNTTVNAPAWSRPSGFINSDRLTPSALVMVLHHPPPAWTVLCM